MLLFSTNMDYAMQPVTPLTPTAEGTSQGAGVVQHLVGVGAVPWGAEG